MPSLEAEKSSADQIRRSRGQTLLLAVAVILLNAVGNLSLTWGLRHIAETMGLNPVDYVRAMVNPFVAGGIGLPPLRPVIHHVLAHRSDFASLVVLYGGRRPADLLFRRELTRWRSRLDVTVDVTVDTAGPDWRGRVGVVTTLIPRAPFDPANTIALVVGPEIMMRYTAEALQARGVAPGDVWVSMERTMRCGVGLCGHCQLGPTLVCRDGPVYRWPYLEPLLGVPEL